jgi:hypothetical protein
MSLDLHQTETMERLSQLRPVTRLEPGVWDDFLSGTARYTMARVAKAGRAIDILGSVGPIIKDIGTGGTELQDRYFKEHDEVFQRAVDYWTPRPGEVGAAAEVAGTLLSLLPLVIASPSLAVGATQLSVAEDLLKKDVSPAKALAVGAVQAAGLGLGIWVPILGQNLWQRAVVGGAGFNVAQGAVTRGVSGTILEGTKAAEDFKAFDWSSVTLDALLGLAFGGIAHLSPAQRAQGEAAWKRIHEWVSTAKPSDIEALAVLRQAEHLNVDSAPGKPEGFLDVEANAAAVRQAVDDLIHGRPVDVENIVGGAKFLPDPERAKVQQQILNELSTQASALLRSDMELQATRRAAEATPGFLRTAEQQLALREPTEANLHPDIAKAIEIARKPGFERTATEKLFLDAMLAGRAGDYLLAGAKRVEATLSEPQTETGLRPGGETGQPDPLAVEAARFADEHPDLELTIGRDADGQPIKKSVKQFLEDTEADVANAREDARLFEVAAACLLGVH